MVFNTMKWESGNLHHLLIPEGHPVQPRATYNLEEHVNARNCLGATVLLAMDNCCTMTFFIHTYIHVLCACTVLFQ